jgi:hypothetical protein
MPNPERDPLDTYFTRLAEVPQGKEDPNPQDYTDAMANLEKRIQKLEEKSD